MGNYNGDDRLEKFYTPKELVDELFILKEKYCDVDVVEYLENSAGGGIICDRFDKPYIAFDIEPEPDRPDIKRANYLKEKIEYKKGRVCVMNPPFASGLKFVNKALKECDWVFCILPQNSILNLDYKKIWAEEIQHWRMYDFGTCKVSISLMALRNRRDGDKYEWE